MFTIEGLVGGVDICRDLPIDALRGRRTEELRLIALVQTCIFFTRVACTSF
jgi:hypothetical protein